MKEGEEKMKEEEEKMKKEDRGGRQPPLLDKKQKRPSWPLLPLLPPSWHRTPRGTPPTVGARDTCGGGGSVLNWLQSWQYSILCIGCMHVTYQSDSWYKDHQIWMNLLRDSFQRLNHCMTSSLSIKNAQLIWHDAITLGMVALSRYETAVLFVPATIVQALSA